MCRAGQWWISPCVELVNGAYTHVQWWSMLDIFMCRADQWCIYSCEVVANGGYTHVQWWSMLDMLRCSSGL